MLKDDDRLRLELREAFDVPALSDEARQAIQRRIRVAHVPRRSLRWRLVGTTCGVLAGLAFGAPIARANYEGYVLATKLRDRSPFTVTMTTDAAPSSPGETIRTKPVIATVAEGVCIVTEPGPGTDTLYRYEPGRLIQFSPRDGKAIVRPVDSGLVRLLELPDLIGEQLASFRLMKKVRSLGKVPVGGRLLDELEVEVDGIFDRILLDLDPQTGEPLRMRIFSKGGFPPTTFDYDRDPVKARKTVARSTSALASAPVVDLDQSRRALAESAAARVLKEVPVGRDHLKIFRIETNRRGDVFVLYTAPGKYGGEEWQGNWLRLEDGQGRPWPSDTVRFNLSKLRLRGRYPKAQVFFSPTGKPAKGKVRLFALMRGLAFVPSDAVGKVDEGDAKRVDLGTHLPARVSVGQPDWAYDAFNFSDPNWLIANGRKLRFLDALQQGNNPEAKRVGLELEAEFPEMMTGFFYDRGQLSLGLYRAFRATGDRTAALRYLRDAIRRNPGPGHPDFDRDLAASRKREGF